ncbi:YfjI family protein [Saltatorellus ferox]|uniref:YfjI family protein n=1 Tax=Saltatorellus ferox TaxID=2528018 RepID=UPI003AF37402
MKGFPKGAARGLVVPEHLDDLPGPVLIVEGASDVAACLTLGLPAVGRPSNSAGSKQLLHLLRDRVVLVVGERDEKPDGRWPGRDGAVAVADKLADRWGRTVPWSLPPAKIKDVREWLASRVSEGLDLADGDACRSNGRLLLQELLTASEPIRPRQGETIPEQAPYPIDALPMSIRNLALEGAVAIGCDPSMIALPAVVACAGVIGLSRDVAIKESWREPCILWGAVVARSGARKDPALDLASGPLREIDEAARRKHDVAKREHETAMQCYLKEEARWKKSKDKEDPPEKPEAPARERLVVQDATYEALTRIVAETSRASVIAIRGELGAWIHEWNEYGSSGRGSSHAAKWLEMNGGRYPAVDRVGAGEVFVSRAAVSVVGAIQPGTLRRLLGGGEHIDSGCAARVLWVMPSFQPSAFSHAVVKEATSQLYATVIQRLHALERVPMLFEDGAVGPQSVRLKLSKRALLIFEGWFNELACQMWQMPDDLASSASKLEGGAARIALVIALVIAAEKGTQVELDEIDEVSMAAGVKLARWHLAESRRIFEVLRGSKPQSGEDRRVAELVDWIEENPDSTARDVYRSLARFKGKDGTKRAKAALEELSRPGGPLVCEQGPKTRHYRKRTVDDDVPDDSSSLGSPAIAESVGVGTDIGPTQERTTPAQAGCSQEDAPSIIDNERPSADGVTDLDWDDPG